MMNDILGSIDQSKLDSAIALIKNALGKEEAERLEKAFAERNSGVDPLISKYSASELAAVKTIIENPQLLKQILSTPKGREAVSKITGK